MFELLETIIPDVLLLDVTMPGMSGIEAAGILTKEYPDIGIIMLTTHQEIEFVFEALDVGARGYLSKDARLEELVEAVKSVADGGGYYSKTISKVIVANHLRRRKKEMAVEKVKLTDREVEVLIAICEGKNNREISEKLFLGVRTVEGYKTNLLRKLELKTVAQLVIYAIKNNYFDID